MNNGNYDSTDLVVFKLYEQNKWCIRPITWCGIWKRVNNDHELVSGNVLGVYNSKEEAESILEEVKRTGVSRWKVHV